MNISRATAVAACYVALKHVFPDVPANAGVLDAVDFVLPDGLVITAERPRPVGGYTETILRMIDVIFSATALADPNRAVAHAYGTINALSIAGHRTDKARAGLVVGLSVWWKKLATDGKNANEVTSQRLTDMGRAPTFYDTLVQVERVAT